MRERRLTVGAAPNCGSGALAANACAAPPPAFGPGASLPHIIQGARHADPAGKRDAQTRSTVLRCLYAGAAPNCGSGVLAANVRAAPPPAFGPRTGLPQQYATVGAAPSPRMPAPRRRPHSPRASHWLTPAAVRPASRRCAGGRWPRRTTARMPAPRPGCPAAPAAAERVGWNR